MKFDVIGYTDKLYNQVKEYGIKFNKYNYPIFPEEFILREIPEDILPYEHRKAAKNKQKTIVCFFAEDEQLYKNFKNLETVAENCSEYMGIAGFDLSPCVYWDIKQQKLNILLSQLVTLRIAISGVKILPNFRIGDLNTIQALSSYPNNTIYSVGSLGCSKRVSKFNPIQFRAKLIYARPQGLIYYGKLLEPYQIMLDELGIKYKVFADFRSKCMSRKGGKNV